MVTETIKTRSYNELASQIDAVEKMGKWIARSRMFGCQTEEQGCVIAADCFITGMPLLEYQARNSLVMGRPSIPYDAMLAAFHERGGKSKINSKTPDLASVTLTRDGQSQEFALSWEEAQKETFPYAGKEDDIVLALSQGQAPPLKPKYATPRSRAIMLFARVVSDGVRTMAPEVNFGSYTPEEIEDFAKPSPAGNGSDGVSAAAPAKPISQEPPTQSVVTSDEPPATNTTDGKHSQSLSEPLTEEQRTRILDLMGQLKQSGVVDIVARVKAKLDAVGLTALADLSIGEGDAMIRALEAKQIDQWAESQITGHAKNPR